MKGVKINNYIDNRIVLSSRKLKNQVQTLIQTNRPRPLVIRNVNYVQQDQDGAFNTQQKQTLKVIQSKSAKKLKKKSKNQNGLANQIKDQNVLKQQKKIKTRKLSSRKNTSAKKRDSSSSPSGNQELQLNQTQKRLKVVQKYVTGLGQRSKSAIIKRNKSPPNVILESQKKNFDDMDMKLNLNKRKEGQSTKKKGLKKDKKQNSSNKQKPLRKNLSTINVSQKKKLKDKQIETKTSRAISKSYMSSSKKSKTVSARQNKKKDSNTNTNNIVRNLFPQQDQTLHIQKQPITLEKLLNIPKNDVKIIDALSKLEIAINTQSNRKKLSQKLELLAEKLKQIQSQQSQVLKQIQQPQSESECIYLNDIQNKSDVQQFVAVIQQNKKQTPQKQQQIQNKFTNTIIVSKIVEKQQESIQEHLLQKDIKQLGTKQINNQIYISSIQNQIVNWVEAKKQSYKKDSDNLRENLQRQNGIYEQKEQQQNPLIGRKIGGDPYVDLVDYDSINSVKSNPQNDKKNQINQLKKFQQESDLMMKKIKQLEQKKKKQQLPLNLKPQNQMKLSIEPINNPNPKGLEIKKYAFEKYPSVQSLKSPKFNSQQIIQVIKLKQRVITDRHQKLSQLVNVMFDKKIVSPKTYSIQIQSLREQHIQNNEVLDNYRKHAEELAQLLIQIKKQKQQISSIDELIRSEKWNQAMTVIKQNQKNITNDKKEQKIKQNHFDQGPKSIRQYSEQFQQQQQPVYYDGQDSEVDTAAIKLIQVEHQQNQHNEKPIEAGKTIKIDESNITAPKKQKGFDSNLFFIKQYCIALCEYVRDYNKQNFRARIGKPMSYNLTSLLKSFRTNRDGSIPHTINSLYEDLSYHDIDFHENHQPISLQIFDKFNKQYGGIKYYGKQQTQDAELQEIFLKSIFDALNQSISIEKPGSISGKALPWANSSKHLKNLKNSLKNSCDQKFKNQQSQDLIFGIAIARIIQWGSCLCGFIPDTVQLQNTQIDQQYINHIRQTRTALLLQKMLIDEQASMYRTELAQTQVKLCLQRILFEQLTKEVAQDMRKIVLRATLRNVDY